MKEAPSDECKGCYKQASWEGLQSSSVKYTDVTTDITFADNTTMKIVDGPSKLGFTSLGAAHGSIRIGWRF
jgi:hypothetical protein